MKNIDKTNNELLRELNTLKQENTNLKAKYDKDISNSNRTESKFVGSEIKFQSILNTNSDTVIQNDEQNIRQLFENYLQMYSFCDDRLTTLLQIHEE